MKTVQIHYRKNSRNALNHLKSIVFFRKKRALICNHRSFKVILDHFLQNMISLTNKQLNKTALKTSAETKLIFIQFLGPYQEWVLLSIYPPFPSNIARLNSQLSIKKEISIQLFIMETSIIKQCQCTGMDLRNQSSFLILYLKKTGQSIKYWNDTGNDIHLLNIIQILKQFY